jgi:hypothetical protein
MSNILQKFFAGSSCFVRQDGHCNVYCWEIEFRARIFTNVQVFFIQVLCVVRFTIAEVSKDVTAFVCSAKVFQVEACLDGLSLNIEVFDPSHHQWRCRQPHGVTCHYTWIFSNTTATVSNLSRFSLFSATPHKLRGLLNFLLTIFGR